MPLEVAPFPDFYQLLLWVGEEMRKARKERHLIALVVANPAHGFAAEHVFPNMPYWHFRSGNAVTLAFPGFPLSPLDEKRFDAERAFSSYKFAAL